MRARRRVKNLAKQKVREFPQRILFDDSTYQENLRPELKKQLQKLIKKHAKKDIFLEIGMGSGEFTNELAIRNPNALCIGIELKEERILQGMTESNENNIENTIYIRISALYLDEIFKKGQISTIFMNCPDPWPKAKHIKNRMTSPTFLEKYKKILSDDGEFILKTDSRIVFEFSQETLAANGFQITKINKNLKDSKNNIKTRYENRFRKANLPIYKLIARKAIL